MVHARADQPGLGEYARRWWPMALGAVVVTLTLIATYLFLGTGPQASGAAAAERDATAPGRAAALHARDAASTGERIGSYTTRFKPGEPRVRNIAIAARALNGKVVQPGARFSFNRVVGPRTKRRGYVPAPTIIGSRLVDDTGGGICQVSATLFNAVFEAGLDIRKSQAHSLWMPEYPQGREAAVAYPQLDFVWRNNSGRPVTIRTSLTRGSLTVSLRGTRRYEVRSSNSRRYAFTSYSSAVDSGRKCVPMPGGRGFQIDVWRFLADQGRQVRRERFHTVYQPQARVRCAGR